MTRILVITPVKDSIETTLDTARSIQKSSVELKHVIFNDFSSEESTKILEKEKDQIGYELVNLEDITDHPSPNYKLVLQMAQKRALQENVPLLVVESDVVINPDTIEKLMDAMDSDPRSGLIGSVTVDENGAVNFPYLKFKNVEKPFIQTSRSLSFCCTLFSPAFLTSWDFTDLDEAKDWYDTYISKKSIELGFQNTVLMDAPVLHRPHSSRPWKQLKYTNPLKYYFLKFLRGRDKI